jgi:hypothetical protein
MFNVCFLQYVGCINFHTNAWLDIIDKEGRPSEIPDIFIYARRIVLDIAFGECFVDSLEVDFNIKFSFKESIMCYQLNAKFGENADYVKAIKKYGYCWSHQFVLCEYEFTTLIFLLGSQN